MGEADPSVALVLSQHLLFHASLARAREPVAGRRAGAGAALVGGRRRLINALRVEPELGTPARGGLPATVAERRPVGGGWRLRGHKIYSTGIPRLRWLAVWARTDDPEPLVGTFLVEAGTPGYRVEPTWDHLGMRATRSDDVIFEGAEIPLDHAVAVDAGRRRAFEAARPLVPGLEQPGHLVDLHGRGPLGPGLAGRLPQRADADQPRRAAGDAAALPAGGR